MVEIEAAVFKDEVHLLIPWFLDELQEAIFKSGKQFPYGSFLLDHILMLDSLEQGDLSEHGRGHTLCWNLSLLVTHDLSR